MDDKSIGKWIHSQIGDVVDSGEAIDRLDALSINRDLGEAYRLALEGMALQLCIREKRIAEAWRRYRVLAHNQAASPAMLALQMVGLGDIAIDMDDAGALGRARTELARLLAIAREQISSHWGPDGDWPAMAQVLSDWDCPDILRARRLFETRVADWLRDSGAQSPDCLGALSALAAEACRRAPEGGTKLLIDGRRAFLAISILAGEQSEVEGAWLEYRASAGNMTMRDRATALLVIARVIETRRVPANLASAVNAELDRLVMDWPAPVTLAEDQTRDALRPVLADLALNLKSRA